MNIGLQEHHAHILANDRYHGKPNKTNVLTMTYDEIYDTLKKGVGKRKNIICDCSEEIIKNEFLIMNVGREHYGFSKLYTWGSSPIFINWVENPLEGI